MENEEAKLNKICVEFNEKLKAKADGKEIVTGEYAVAALYIARNYKVKKLGDLLLLASALNLLNTYVKQCPENTEEVGYCFKASTSELIRYITQNPSEYTRYEFQTESNMPLLILEICSVQFSFHRINVPKEYEGYSSVAPEDYRLKWDGIRKQRCAVSLFDFAMENKLCRTDKMLDDPAYMEEVNSLIADYRAGRKKITDVMRILYPEKTDQADKPDNNEKKFRAECSALNRKFRESSAPREVVSDENAFVALVIAKNYFVQEIGDLFLYATALNLLNTYVKQSKKNKKTIGYCFKTGTDVIVRYILQNPEEPVLFEFQKDNNMSLLLTEICSVQFSFHGVQIPSDCQEVTFAEPGNCKLKWDGIRKQRCAVSLFDFALNNRFGRTDKLLDGSDFRTELDRLLAAFRKGKKSLADVKHTIYPKKHDKERNNEEPAKPKEDVTEKYPLRKNRSVLFYSDTVGEFIRAVEERTFVDSLVKTYEEDFGLQVSFSMKQDWKYEFETLMSVLTSAGSNSSAGFALILQRSINYEFFSVLLISRGEKQKIGKGVILNLIPWTDVRRSEKAGMLEYYNPSMGRYIEVFNPNIIPLAALQNINPDSMVIENIARQTAIFFYDSGREKLRDAASASSAENRDISDRLFFSADRKRLCSFISEAVQNGNGAEALSRFTTNYRQAVSQLETFSEQIVDADSILSLLGEKIQCGKPFLATISDRCYKNNDGYIRYIEDNLGKLGASFCILNSEPGEDDIPAGAKIVVYSGFVPKKIDFFAAPYHIILSDVFLLDESDRRSYIQTRMIVRSRGIECCSYTLSVARWFCDEGHGNDLLMKLFGYRSVLTGKWNPELYPIDVVDNFASAPVKEGIADITLDNSFSYNASAEEIIADDENREGLYRALLKGRCGVRLLIMNEELKQYVSQTVGRLRKLHHNLKCSLAEYEKTADYLQQYGYIVPYNSSEYKIYCSELIKFLGTDCWNKLCKNSRNYLVSALASFYDLKNRDRMMDFSGVVLTVSKVFETEICRRVCADYLDYLKERFSDDLLGHVPDALTCEKSDTGEIAVINPQYVTMGAFSHVMGLNGDGTVDNEDDYRLFTDYACKNLLASADNVPQQLKEMCSIIDNVRVKFRNRASHKEAISLRVANECISYCITGKRALGVIMEMFRY